MAKATGTDSATKRNDGFPRFPGLYVGDLPCGIVETTEQAPPPPPVIKRTPTIPNHYEALQVLADYCTLPMRDFMTRYTCNAEGECHALARMAQKVVAGGHYGY